MRQGTTGTAVGTTEKHADVVDLSTPSCPCASWAGPVSLIGGHHHNCERYDALRERMKWQTIVCGLLDEIDAGVTDGPHHQTAVRVLEHQRGYLDAMKKALGRVGRITV